MSSKSKSQPKLVQQYYYGIGPITIKSDGYYVNNKLHRDNGPAEIKYFEDGAKLAEIWYKKGYMYRKDDLPAFIEYHRNGNKSIEVWIKDNLPHRKDGPARILYHENGAISVKEWYDKRYPNLLHHPKDPAVIKYNEDGMKISEEWYQRERRDRKNKPAVIEYDENGQTHLEKWYTQNLLHRLDGPAIIEYYKNGQRRLEEWYVLGHNHRLDGPAAIEYYKDGKKGLEKWYVEHRLHNTKNPAWIEYDENGQRRLEKWYVRNLLHRIDDAAVIRYDEHGKRISEEWRINDTYLTRIEARIQKAKTWSKTKISTVEKEEHYALVLGSDYQNRVLNGKSGKNETVSDYLSKDVDNIIIVIDGKELFGTHMEQLSLAPVLYECFKLGSGDTRDKGDIGYISLAALGCPCTGVVNYTAAERVIESDYRIFSIRDSGKKTGTLDRMYGNCQSGTEMSIYEIYIQH